MKLHGTFLAGAAARRIFWTLLAAAAVPIALFGAGIHGALASHFESQARRQQVQVSKLAGMGVLDRLVVARTVLEISARTGLPDADSRIGNERGRVLSAIARVDTQGRWLDGSPTLHTRWHELAPRWDARGTASGATLVLGDHLATADAMPVLLVVRTSAGDDTAWIGEVDPAFLFDELTPDANGSRLCVFDDRGRPIFCPAAHSGQAGDTRPLEAPSWNLFLKSDFGSSDWTLVQLDAPTDGFGNAGTLMRLSTLGALATLLIVVMLTLVQVRRTMVPLQMLIAGTRRLSERDYDARVQIGRHDEFGELAHSFNHMAERIGRQVQAMHVQASIDREILGGLDVTRALQRVAQRLEQIVPRASAAVIELSHDMLARAHRSDGALALLNVPPAGALALASLGEITRDRPPPWVQQALCRPAAHWLVLPARSGEQLLALLVIGFDAQPTVDPDTQREIGELCDRVSVMLASADRERRLVERAIRDGLTGLANRAGLYEFIEQRLADPRGLPFTVLFVDLDRFKEVNDSLGHLVGDEMLRAIAQRLTALVPPGTLVARQGGDEFVLVVPGARDRAAALAERLRVELAAPVALAGRSLAVGASLGLAQHPDHGGSASDLIRRADMAMYSAKARGGNAAAWFEPGLDARMKERMAMLADLRHALALGQFELLYQPRVDVRSGTMRSAEALLRWRHPDHAQVPTLKFIELLEETGQIESVGLWALEQACRQLVRWRAAELGVEAIAVNLSTRQLQSAGFVEQVLSVLERCALPPGSLELEVTESIFIGDSAPAILALQRLHAAGVRIALDDFGTGYSSLSYLHRLPIDILKVDRSFVAEVCQRDKATALARSIVALARALGLRVVAEGVETPQQAEHLSALGCDELQGYLYARPLTPDALSAFAVRAAAASPAIAAPSCV